MSDLAKILLIGRTGQVGHALAALDWPDAELVTVDRTEADLTDSLGLTELVRKHRPDLVINAAAYTAVDLAETERTTNCLANAEAPAALALGCDEVGARLIHFSTDYVFDGTGSTPYREEDAVCPVNAYGAAKLRGEQAVLEGRHRNVVFRLSWVYAARGKNFALTMLRLANGGKPIRVVADQVGSPTYVGAIADGVQAIVRQLLQDDEAPGGLFHLSAGGETSWHGFAQALLNEALKEGAPTVGPIPTSDYPTPAKRPAYSVLSNEKVAERFGVRLPDWRTQLERWVQDLPAA